MKQPTQKTRQSTRAFTLIEIMIVIAIIGIIIAIAASTWMRQRETARSRSCQENLAKIDGAIEQYALDENLGHDQAVTDIAVLVGPTRYLKRTPECPASGDYAITKVGASPTCTYDAPDWAPQHEIEPAADPAPAG